MLPSDLIIAIGYDPIEYEARNRNTQRISARIIVLMLNLLRWMLLPARTAELIGVCETTFRLLLPAIQGYKLPEGSVEYLKGLNTVVKMLKFDRQRRRYRTSLDLIEVLQEQTDASSYR